MCLFERRSRWWIGYRFMNIHPGQPQTAFVGIFPSGSLHIDSRLTFDEIPSVEIRRRNKRHRRGCELTCYRSVGITRSKIQRSLLLIWGRLGASSSLSE